MKPIRTLFLATLVVSMSGCIIVTDVDADWDWLDDGWTKRTETVIDVDRIEFNARGTLYITQGTRDALQLEGHEGALGQLEIEQADGTLVISQSGDSYRWFEVRKNGKEPVYSLQIADLRAIKHAGHGEINVGPFTIDELEITSTSHAKTNLASINGERVAISVRNHGRVVVETLDSNAVDFRSRDHGDIFVHDANVLDATVDATGHGEVVIAGRADSLSVNLHDHSDLDSSDFQTAVTHARVNDHANALIHASEEAILDERDHANVVVSGDARVVARESGR